MGLVDLFRFFNVGFKNKYKYIESFRRIYEVVEVLEIKLQRGKEKVMGKGIRSKISKD